MNNRILLCLIVCVAWAHLAVASDACPATVITSVPFQEIAVQSALNNDFDSPSYSCLGHRVDFIYAFTPLVSGFYPLAIECLDGDPDPATVTIHLRTGGACPGTVWDFCLYFGGLDGLYRTNLDLTAGVQYFIIVEPPYIPCDTIQFTLGPPSGSPNALSNECLFEYMWGDSNALEDCNGGCTNEDNGGQFAAQDLLNGLSVNGRAFKYMFQIDTLDFEARLDNDYYTLPVLPNSIVSIEFETEFDAVLALFSGADCTTPIGFFVPDTGVQNILVTECLGNLRDNTLMVQVIPSYLYQFTVGQPRFYSLRFGRSTCPSCEDYETPRGAPGSWNLGSTCGAGNDCNQWPSQELTVPIYIPDAGWWTFGLCGSSPTWPAVLNLSESCCGPTIGQGAGGCPNGMAEIDGLFLEAGMYYLGVEGLNAGNCGNVTLNVEQLLGRCCYGPESAPSCSDATWSECEALGGQYISNETCAGEPCPVRPLCDRDGGVSQPPHVPTESNHFEVTARVLACHRRCV